MKRALPTEARNALGAVVGRVLEPPAGRRVKAQMIFKALVDQGWIQRKGV